MSGLSLPEFTEAAVTASEATASYERLRQELAARGVELQPVTFICCDGCEQIKPESEIDHDSPSGINLCRDREACLTIQRQREGSR